MYNDTRMHEQISHHFSIGSSGWVGEGERNMKSMWPPLAAIFFMTYLYRAGGPWPPRHPPPGSTTAFGTSFCPIISPFFHIRQAMHQWGPDIGNSSLHACHIEFSNIRFYEYIKTTHHNPTDTHNI